MQVVSNKVARPPKLQGQGNRPEATQYSGQVNEETEERVNTPLQDKLWQPVMNIKGMVHPLPGRLLRVLAGIMAVLSKQTTLLLQMCQELI